MSIYTYAFLSCAVQPNHNEAIVFYPSDQELINGIDTSFDGEPGAPGKQRKTKDNTLIKVKVIT